MKTGNRAPRARRVVGDILLALAVLLTADVVIVMLHKISAVVLKADYREVFVYQLILCGILLLFALDVRFNLFTRAKNRVARGVGWVLRAAVACMVMVIACFCGKVIWGGVIDTAGPADNAIVLGLALENGQPTGDLLSRLDTARAYLGEYPESRLILTGGNASESGRTEAAVMRDIMAERGVAEDRMRLEDQAESTKENFRNTARIIDPGEPVVLISSNYHMDRAVQTAKAAGFTDIRRLPAPSSLLRYGANVMSEVVLEINELAKKR